MITSELLSRLRRAYPSAKIALDYSNPLELLLATILSAQCTDKRVNMVTESLFRKYRTPKDYANALDLETDIRSTGFFNNKAKNIRAAAKIIAEKHNGRVPDTMDELVQLPGVARKTANVVLSNAFHKIEGIAVDTHVARLSGRLGLSKRKDPEKIEQDLMKLFPMQDWPSLTHRLIEHGRAVCDAKKPKCRECFLKDICPMIGVKNA